MESDELKIYNNLSVLGNFLTTNTCYIKENINLDGIGKKSQFLAKLSFLYKNDVNILLTNCTIKLFSNIFKKYSYPEYNFSYLDIYKKYNENPEFINISITELNLNFPYFR